MRDLILGESLDALMDYRGKTPKKLGAEFTDGGVPVASAILVDNGVLDLSNPRFVSNDTYVKWMSTPTRRGDVLLTSEAPLGRVARVPSDEPLVLGQRLFGLRGREGVLDNGFLYYALQTDSVRADLLGRSTGTTVFGIRQSALRNVRIPAPSYSGQRAIAEVLGALDDKIAANTRLLGNLDELFITRWRQVDNHAAARERSLDSMVLDSIGGDWGVERATPTFTEAVYCIRGADISSLQESGLGKMPIRHIKGTSLERRNTRDGDIVVEMSGGSPTQSTGRAALITDHLINRLDKPIVSSNFCRVLRLQDSTYSHFIYAMLRWDWTIGEFFQFENGSTGIKNLAFKEYSARKLVPSLTPGDLSSFNSEADALLAYAHSAGEETERLIATRDALLPQLMSGKLRVKDAEKVLEGVL